MKQDLIIYSTLGALSLLSAGVCGYIYNKWKKVIEDLKVVYTVSEAACLDIDKNPKTLLIQGLLQNKNKGKYLFYSSIVQDNQSYGNLELKDGSFMIHPKNDSIHSYWHKQCYFQDQFDTNQKILMNIDKNTQFLGDCFNYRKKQRYEHNKDFFQKIFTMIYSLFSKKTVCTYIEDNQIGIQFGLPVVVLADIKYDGSLFIDRVQLVTAKSSQYIIQIHKRQKNFLLFLTAVFSVVGIMLAIEAYDTYSKLCLENVKREINDMNRSLPFKKSISKVLTNPRDDELCLVCQTSIRSVIFQPCQHFVCCHTCYEQLQAKPDYKQCVYCRANIIKIVRVIEETIQG